MRKIAKYGISFLVLISVVCALKFMIEIIHTYIEEIKEVNKLAWNSVH